MSRFSGIITATLLTLASLSSSFSVTAATPTWQTTSAQTLELAKQYNQYLIDNNTEKAMAMAAPGLVFSDPTWGIYDQNKATAKASYSASTARYHNITYDIRNIMSSRGTVVIHMIGSADIDPIGVKDPAKRVHIMADLIRVITIKEGKVIRHTDLSDYDKIMPKLESAAQKS